MRRVLPYMRNLLDWQSQAGRDRQLRRKPVGMMKTSHVPRTLIVMLALEWELCSEDPFIFCYRIGVEPVRIFLGRFGKRR
jgi:hypothetical protein